MIVVYDSYRKNWGLCADNTFDSFSPFFFLFSPLMQASRTSRLSPPLKQLATLNRMANHSPPLPTNQQQARIRRAPLAIKPTNHRVQPIKNNQRRRRRRVRRPVRVLCVERRRARSAALNHRVRVSAQFVSYCLSHILIAHQWFLLSHSVFTHSLVLL